MDWGREFYYMSKLFNNDNKFGKCFGDWSPSSVQELKQILEQLVQLMTDHCAPNKQATLMNNSTKHPIQMAKDQRYIFQSNNWAQYICNIRKLKYHFI